MKKRVSFLLSYILLVVFLITGCGQQAAIDKRENSIEESMSSDFYYVIEDTFSLTDRDDLVVVGINENSPLYVGAEVDILSSAERIPTRVLAIELYGKEQVDSVEAGSYAGVLLAGLTKEQVNAGDLLVLRNQGFVTDKADALVTPINKSDDQGVIELSEGQNIQVVIYDRPIDATVTSIETTSEAADGNVAFVSLKFAETIACQNDQKMAILDEDGHSIATGYFVFSKE